MTVGEESDLDGRWRVRVELQVDPDLWPEVPPAGADDNPEWSKAMATMARRSHRGQVAGFVRRIADQTVKKWSDSETERRADGRVGV